MWGAITIAWAVVVMRLTTAWSADLEQAHGWAVPFLCAWLFRERRSSAPAPMMPGSAPAIGLTCGGSLGLLVTLPVLEANRLWPAAQWAAATSAVMVSVGLLAFSGGWRWARHFAFPLFFASTALMWPAMVQVPLLKALATFNAALAAEIVSLLGYPALARGSLIEVGAGIVGVDEACAGLRSMQAVWMLTWFAGELLRFRGGGRIALVGMGLLAAFLGNVLRTIFLTLQNAVGGAEQGERWHDVAGDVAMIGTYAAVALVAWWLAKRMPRHVVSEANWSVRMLPRLRPLGVAVIVFGVSLEGGMRWWFGSQAIEAGGVQWQLQEPADGWTPFTISPRVRAILQYSEAEAFSWNAHDGSRQAVAYAFRWDAVGQLGLGGVAHAPTVCMPYLGAELEAKLSAEPVVIAGKEIQFTLYRFAAAGTTQHVFYAVWDAFHGRMMSDRTNEFLPAHRLERVREGRNHADVAHVVFVLQGEPDDNAAREWLQRVAAEMLHVRQRVR